MRIQRKPASQRSKVEQEFLMKFQQRSAKIQQRRAQRYVRQEEYAKWIAEKPEAERTEQERRMLWLAQRRAFLKVHKLPTETLGDYLQRLSRKPQNQLHFVEQKLLKQLEQRRLKKQLMAQEAEISWHRVSTDTSRQSTDPKSNFSPLPQKPSHLVTLSSSSLANLQERMKRLGLSSDRLHVSSLSLTDNETSDPF